MAVLLADLVNRADVGMIQRRGGPGFAAEPFEGLRVASDVLRKKFQRNETAELGVFRFVDDAHAAATEFFDHPIVGDGEADGRLGFRHAWRTS